MPAVGYDIIQIARNLDFGQAGHFTFAVVSGIEKVYPGGKSLCKPLGHMAYFALGNILESGRRQILNGKFQIFCDVSVHIVRICLTFNFKLFRSCDQGYVTKTGLCHEIPVGPEHPGLGHILIFQLGVCPPVNIFCLFHHHIASSDGTPDL